MAGFTRSGLNKSVERTKKFIEQNFNEDNSISSFMIRSDFKTVRVLSILKEKSKKMTKEELQIESKINLSDLITILNSLVSLGLVKKENKTYKITPNARGQIGLSTQMAESFFPAALFSNRCS